MIYSLQRYSGNRKFYIIGTALIIQNVGFVRDSNVGVVRELTLEPNVTSTRGYMEVKNKEGVEDLNSANLFTAAELLTPIGVTHDDPDRTSINACIDVDVKPRELLESL